MDETADGGPSQVTVTAGGPAAPRAPAPTLPRGATVGRYVIVDFVDRGGMGVVYRAFDPELNRSVALKLVALDPRAGSEGTQRSRLLREAQALAQLSHPNVVTVHDVGPYDDGVFMAMEFVEGRTLKTYLSEGRHPRAELLEVLTAAGHGLAAAHQAGITHRDFKPANVIIGDRGRVRVIDFGLARASDESLETPVPRPPGAAEPPLLTPLTVVGLIVGTPGYMAPEQHAARETTARSDQFSFCVVLFEALYGARPFTGATREQLADNIRAGRITRPEHHDVPEWLDRVACRGLRADPAERYPSMDALLADLGHDPAVARAQGRARVTRIGLAGVTLTSLVAAGWLHLRGRADAPEPCPIDPGRLAGAWDDAVRARVRARFDAVGKAYVKGTFPRVAVLLDDYARAWLDARREACAATRVRGEQSAALLDLRMQCLDRRLGQLRELTRLFAEADAEVVERAVQAAAALDSPTGCDDVQALSSTLAPPADAATAARVSALRDRLARAEALNRAGKYQDARTLARTLVDEAAAIGYLPAQAEVAQLNTAVAWRLSASEDAAATAFDAISFAHAAGHEELLVKAYSDLVVVLGIDLGRFAEAELYARLGDAVLHHLGVEGELRLRWSHAVGAMWMSRGENARALPPLERAHALAVELHGTDHPEVARVLNNLGIVHQQLGDVTRARAAYARAFAIFERSLGGEHPVMGAAHQNLGVAAFLARDYAEARREYEAGARILEATLGPAHPRLGVTLSNLGEVCLVEQDHAQALAYYERARAILEAALGADDPSLAETLNGLAWAHLGLRHVALARSLFERSVALCAQDRCAGNDPLAVAAAHFGLARTLWETGGDRQRAIGLARQALTLNERATSPDAGKARAEYVAWLDAHAGATAGR